MLKVQQTIFLLFALIAVAFALLRFVNLSADMPTNITGSGTLYTDEGIYGRNAAWFVSTGGWYVPGDFNTAVNYPIYFVLQVIVFKLWGVNFEAIRTLSVLSALGVISIVGFIVKRFTSNQAAIITILLISTNFLFFAFSRYGQADMPMLLCVVLSFTCLLLSHSTPKLIFTVFSAIFLLFALLIKTSAAFAFPVLVLLIWHQQKTTKERLIHLATLTGILGVALLCYRLFLIQPYLDEYLKVSAPLRDRINVSFTSLLQQLEHLLKQILAGEAAIGPMFYAAALITGFCLFVDSKNLRRNWVFRIALSWIIFYCLMLSVSFYHPPRYFSILVIPISIMLSISSDYLLRNKRFHRIGYLSLGLISWVGFQGSFNIVPYLASPQYTMYQVADDINKNIAAEGINSPLLIGHMAGNISLASEILSVGAHLDDDEGFNEDFPIEQYLPTHFISLGEANENIVDKFKKASYRLYLLGIHDVLDNYKGKKVYLYRVMKIDNYSGEASPRNPVHAH